MELNEAQIRKLDPKLTEMFKNSYGSETLMVIMALERNRQTEEQPELHPSQFPNRIEWRKALIARQKEKYALEIGITIEALKELELEVRGGEILPLVVVTGTVANILRAADLDGVKKIIYNHPVSLEV